MIHLPHFIRLFRKNATKVYSRALFAFIISLVSFSSCRSILDEPFTVADCPKVISNFPLDAAINVNSSSTLLVKFNKAMSVSSFNSETFNVFIGSTPIAGTISVKDCTASFLPTQLLEADQHYTAKINNGVRDLANNYMIGSHTWNFSTGLATVISYPTVTSTDPDNSEIAVPFNKKISVVFSKKMDSLSAISAFTVFNTTLGGTDIPGKVTYLGTTAVFSPNSLLAANTTYSATIAKTAKDQQGNKLEDTFIWSFTTGANQDLTSPEVIGTEPSSDVVAVPLNKKISALFNETMDPTSISETTYTIKNGTTPVAGKVTYAGITALFSPLSDLTANTKYTGTITKGAKDLAGNTLAADYVWTFTTGTIPDKTAPLILSTDPANNATNVALDKNLTVRFNENMDPARITTDNFSLRTGTTQVAGYVKSIGTFAIFDPAANLSPSTTYIATVTRHVTDLAGNNMTTEYTWSFKTSAAAVVSPPTIVSTDPGNKAINVALDKAITIRFIENMDPITINASNIKLSDGVNQVNGNVKSNGTFATFTPSVNLAPNTNYYVTVATDVKNLSGKNMVASYTWTFSTTASVPIFIAPSVIYTDPDNGATNVAWDKAIIVRFNEDMKVSTINTDNFSLRAGAVNIAGTVSSNGTYATFSPSANLSPNTTYTGTVTTGVQNLVGTNMSSNFSWSFTTTALAIVIPPPTVLNTDPGNNGTNVALNKTLTVTFNENMDPSTFTNATFTLKNGVNTINGVVNTSGTFATFDPNADLVAGTTYTATVTNGVKSLAGKNLTNSYVWTFSTIAAVIPPVISVNNGPALGAIATYGSFGGNAGITNQGINTVINGDIGTTAASTLITGFHDGTTGDVYTETPLNKGNVTGRIYTAPPAPGTSTSFTQAQAAAAAALSAYNSISPASKPGGTDPGAGELGGLTLAPGVYKAAGGSFAISNGNLVLDGDANAVWIFQATSSLTVGVAGPTGARSITLINGALAKNVYWYVGSAATINGAGGGTMVGTILASAGVTFSTAGNTTQTVLNGRAIGLNASVTMVNTTINVPQ
ncbi:Ig-like domain-containing protein [Aquirufa ecclesiirivi]|uniref:Ig-like domain-containing protein n=1 Tax=Aquirufa ecclesiirivi TaxID=2715124 RepID=UPI003BB12E58